MSFANASRKAVDQIINFSDLAEGRRTTWCLNIKDVIDVFDIAEEIYSKAKGTCAEKLFVVINAIEWAFDVDESDVWKALENVIHWNPWIDELKEIYTNEFIRQDTIGLNEKYNRMNQRMKRK